MADESGGVALLARILDAVSQGEDWTVPSLARALGAARTTTYEVVRQLDAAGFLDRSAAGRITPGPAGAALGFAARGLGGLAGAAEALLPVLRDDTDASVDLLCGRDGTPVVLMRRLAPAPPAGESAAQVLEARIGRSAAWLRLSLRPAAAPTERRAAQACLKAVADALSRDLQGPQTPEPTLPTGS